MFWFLSLLEHIQYSFLYAILGFPFAYINNRIFPPLDKDKSLHRIFLEALIHIVVMALFFYLLKIIVKRVPFIFSFLSKQYIPYRTEEYLGAAVGAFTVFFYLQIYLTDKLTYIADKVFRKYPSQHL